MSTPLQKNDVGVVGFGLMGFTWRATQTPDEQAFKAMDAALAQGAKFWNGGEFYGYPDPSLNLQLLNRYFTANPAAAEKVVLSVKGAVDLKKLAPRGDAEGVRQSVDNILKLLDGKKFLDIFECARVDKNTPIEETVSTLAEYVKAGKIGGIGLSEASSATIRRAHAVHPIAGVELELSLWSTEILTNGIADTCAELGIPIIAYSPLGRGFLTGQIKKLEDIPEGDFRRTMDRFQPENFAINIKLADACDEIAKKKGCTPAQLALGWVLAQGNKPGKAKIIPIPGATTEARVLENMKPVQLSESDLKELDGLIAKFEIKGGRYNAAQEDKLLV